MPTTYNGVGTRYYGKKNVERRKGTCQHCNSNTELTSYDTRLWFVVVFIPVIPMGRKRIVDYCASCTYHYAIELDKWETSKQLEISGALEKYRTNPTPESAIDAHQQLINFHQFSQATEFRQMMREKFSTNAKVQAYLGASLSHLGQLEEAATFFQRALDLRPDLPEARIGMALENIRLHRLDEARRLLDFMEKAGASQLYSLEPLERLALAYQNGNRHTEALELFERMQQELPKIVELKAFRDMVKKSEKALNKGGSMLPKQPFSWRRFFRGNQMTPRPQGPAVTWRGLAVVSAIVGAVVLTLVLTNEHIRQNRKVHVLNPLGQPATIQVQGVGDFKVNRTHGEITLPEGRYRALITGPVKEEVDFEVRSTYFSRWSGDPAWVLDIGKASVLVLQEAVYSKNPREGSVSLHAGKSFYSFPRVTHLFTSLPDSVRMKSHEERIYMQLDVFRGEMNDAFQYLLQQRALDQALQLAERQLALNPRDNALLHSYVLAVQTHKKMDRAEPFLRAGLTNQPIVIEWHRLYQTLHPGMKREAQFAEFYDSMLKTDPTNSALLYLRGRVTADPDESLNWFTRARAADPTNPYAHYALGIHYLSAGDWAQAKQLLGKANSLRPNDATFGFYLQSARFALHEFSDLEKELQQRLKNEPLDYYAATGLCDVLLAEGKADEAQQVISAYEKQTASMGRTRAREVQNLIHRYWLYAIGDFAALEKHSTGDRTPAGQNSLFYALIEQARIAEAKQIHPIDEKVDDAIHFLTVAIACRASGDKDEADRWTKRAIEMLDAGNGDDVYAASLLKKTEPPTVADLARVHVHTKSKALLSLALAQMHPEKRAEFSAVARSFNIGRQYPYHLIERLTSVQ